MVSVVGGRARDSLCIQCVASVTTQAPDPRARAVEEVNRGAIRGRAGTA